MAKITVTAGISGVAPGKYNVRVALDDEAGTIELAKASTPVTVPEPPSSPVVAPPTAVVEP